MYQTEDGKTKIDVQLENETVWLTQAQIAELFQRDRSVISKHIKNVFAEGELNEKSNVQILHIANSDKHDILTGAGKISAAMAEKKAKEEYKKYRSSLCRLP